MKNFYTHLNRMMKPIVLMSFLFAFIINVNATVSPTFTPNVISTTQGPNFCGSVSPIITGTTVTITNATYPPNGVASCSDVMYKWIYSYDLVTWYDINSYSTANIDFPTGFSIAYVSGLYTAVYVKRVAYASCTQPVFSFRENWSNYLEYDVFAPFTLSTSQTNLLCNGNTNGTATVTTIGGYPNYTYDWTTTPPQSTITASTSNQVTGLSGGTYTVTVTDLAGCMATATITITQPGLLNLSITTVSPTCTTNGSLDLTVSGGTSPYTYAWTGPSGFTSSLEDLTSINVGTYTVTVTDHNGCTASTSRTFVQSNTITENIVGTNVKCYGGFTGAADLTVSGGSTPYTYAWTGPSLFTAATQDLTGIKSGTYNVTITDHNGCTKTDAVTITQPLSPLAIDNIAVSDLTCFNNHTGSALVTVVDGTSPYTYAWTGPNSFTASTALITGLAAGTYTCTVSDHNGCSTIQGALVKEPSDLTATISGTNILCNGNSTGTVSLTVNGGTTPYTYAWTGPNSFTASIKDLSNIKAGTYTVTISDKNHCSIIKSITITEPLAPITTGIQKTDVKCYGGFTGAADLTVNGGTTPYTYAWTGPSLFTASTQDLTGIKFGTYNVTVTDQNGCTKTNTVTITQPLSPLAIDNIAVSDLTCFNNHTGDQDEKLRS